MTIFKTNACLKSIKTFAIKSIILHSTVRAELFSTIDVMYNLLCVNAIFVQPSTTGTSNPISILFITLVKLKTKTTYIFSINCGNSGQRGYITFSQSLQLFPGFITIITTLSFFIDLTSFLVFTYFSFLCFLFAFFAAGIAFFSAANAFFFFCCSSFSFLLCSLSNFLLSFSSCCFFIFSSDSLRMAAHLPLVSTLAPEIRTAVS